MKKPYIGPPSIYLGNKVSKLAMENGVKCWIFSYSHYVQTSVNNAEIYLRRSNKSISRKASTIFTTDFRPGIDISKEISPGEVTYYQSMIRIMHWIIELGRINISDEVLMLSSMMIFLQRGHLN